MVLLSHCGQHPARKLSRDLCQSEHCSERVSELRVLNINGIFINTGELLLLELVLAEMTVRSHGGWGGRSRVIDLQRAKSPSEASELGLLMAICPKHDFAL